MMSQHYQPKRSWQWWKWATTNPRRRRPELLSAERKLMSQWNWKALLWVLRGDTSTDKNDIFLNFSRLEIYKGDLCSLPSQVINFPFHVFFSLCTSVHTQLRRINCIIFFYCLLLGDALRFTRTAVTKRTEKNWHSSPPQHPSHSRFSTSIWSFASTLFILLNCHNFFPTINHRQSWRGIDVKKVFSEWTNLCWLCSLLFMIWHFKKLGKNLFRRWDYDDTCVWFLYCKYGVVITCNTWTGSFDDL